MKRFTDLLLALATIAALSAWPAGEPVFHPSYNSQQGCACRE